MKNFLFEIDGEEIIILADDKNDAWAKLRKYFNIYDFNIVCYGEISEEDAENMGIDVYD